jgi:hypothetical protein
MMQPYKNLIEIDNLVDWIRRNYSDALVIEA